MNKTLRDIKNIVGDDNVLTSIWNKKPYTKGWKCLSSSKAFYFIADMENFRDMCQG